MAEDNESGETSYSNITNPYNSFLQRTSVTTPTDNLFTQDEESDQNNTSTSGSISSLNSSDKSNGNVQTSTVNSGGAMSNVYITSFIASKNWKPKNIGFYIDGQTGYAEFSDLFIKGGISASSFDIPFDIRYAATTAALRC